MRLGHRRGIHFIELQKPQGRFIFELALPDRRDLNKQRIIALLALLTLVVLAAFLAIRKILKPIHQLTEGVQQVGNGNLDYQVQRKKQDEFGELAAAFNEMTHRIRDMLQAKEQLLLDVSHELRSPLTRMKVALELLPDNDFKRSITEDVADMEQMITEILETARLRSTHYQLKQQPVDMAGLIRETIAVFRNQPPGVQTGQLPEGAVTYADPELMKIVLNNIINNAIKYSGDHTEPVEINLRQTPDRVSVKIRDNGEGIPPNELPHVFEPFYRVDKSRSKRTGGYGLGLSLCKTIVEAHQGKIGIKSERGQGTTVTIVLPRRKNGENAHA